MAASDTGAHSVRSVRYHEDAAYADVTAGVAYRRIRAGTIKV